MVRLYGNGGSSRPRAYAPRFSVGWFFISFGRLVVSYFNYNIFTERVNKFFFRYTDLTQKYNNNTVMTYPDMDKLCLF